MALATLPNDASDTVPVWPPFADTVATGPGGGDPVGDDQCQRTSDWGGLDECAQEGGIYREPVAAIGSGSESLRLLAYAVTLVGAIAAASIFSGCPMAWPLG